MPDRPIYNPRVTGEAFRILLEQLGGTLAEPLATSVSQLHNHRYKFNSVTDPDAFRILLDILADSEQLPDPLRENIEAIRDAVWQSDVAETKREVNNWKLLNRTQHHV